MGKDIRSRIFTVGLLGMLLISVFASPLASFITPVNAVTILTLKWSRTQLGTNWEGGMVIGDVTGDGLEDIVYGGNDQLVVLNGNTGATIATYSQTRIGQYCQPQCYDVDGDGVLDILVPLYYSPGLAAVRYDGDSTLQQMWLVNTEGTGGSGSVMAKPVAGHVDGDGHLDIFIGSQDVSPIGNYDGTLCRINYLGQIVAQTFTWRPCSGGLSLGDTDNDGVFELYQGDRQMGYSDGGYGGGLKSYWADNLTLRWARLDFLSSSQSPVLADVNGDGVLDVLAGMYREMNVLNSTNGERIRRIANNTMSVHYGFTVYDIDADGNLELLCSDGDHDNDWFVDVFDLVTGAGDAQIPLGKLNATWGYDWKWGPTIADIYDNGVNANGSPRMEIIMAGNTTRMVTGGRQYTGEMLIYDNQYALLQNVTGLNNQIGYPFVQDIDADDLLEVVFMSNTGVVRAYDTAKAAPSDSQRIRSEVTYFGEQRLGVAEHTIMPGDLDEDYWTAPLLGFVYPADNALAVPISADLSFRTRDEQGDAISWSLTTSPDVGSGSGSIGSGTANWNTRTVTLPDLAYDTTYRWTVSVTAGGQTITRTYTFRTELFNPANGAPSQGDPNLIPLDGIGMTTSTFEITPTGQSDPNGNSITNIYRWTVDGAPVAQLLLPFDTRDEASTKDYSGNNNNGQVIGAAWVPNGRVGGAYSFDGKDDAIMVSDGGLGYYDNHTYPAYPNHEELGGMSNWEAVTVEAWVYLTENNYGSLVVGKIPSYAIGFQSGSSPPNRLMAAVWPAMYEIAEDDNQASTDRMRNVNYNTALQLNTWYHIAFTYESGVGIKLYLNGVNVATSSAYTGVLQGSRGAPVYIGRLVEPFAGMIDDVRLYNYAMPQSQISIRYNESKDGGSASSRYLPLIFAAPGDVLGCDVIPTDSYAEGPTRSDTFTLQNTPPTASNPRIIPQRDRVYRLDGENLIASYVYNDPDGNPESGTTIAWYRNSTFFGNQVQVLSGSTQIGDTWYFTVTPRDSNGGVGSANTSDTVTIRGNQAPGTSAPSMSGVRDDDDIVATATATDTDGDDTTNIFHWTKGGVSQTNLQLPFDTEVPTIPGANGVTLDYSGYGNEGIVNGSTWKQDGVVGGAFSFDGNDYITVQESGNTLGGSGSWSAITVEAWVKASGTTGAESILFKPDSLYGVEDAESSTGYRLQYRYYADSYLASWGINNGTALTSISSPRIYETPLGWHHIVATYQSGVGLKIYTDGQLRLTRALAGNINATLNGLLYIGGAGGSSDFRGQLDEVRIYSTVLSAAQVFQRFIETRDGLSSTSTIVPQETTTGNVWLCQVTPNDSWADGSTVDSDPITIVAGNTKPRIDWFSPADSTPDVLQGGALNFTQVSSDPSGSVLNYAWTVNGSPMASTQNFTYTFPLAGIVPVRVTVTEQDGPYSDYQEWTVNVISSETRDLEILAYSHGTTNPIPNVYTYPINTDASVQAIPDPGYMLHHWVLDGTTDIGSDNPCVLTMDNDYTLQPVFVDIPDLALTVRGVGDQLWWSTVDTGTKIQSSWNGLAGSTPSSPATFVSGTTMYIGVRGGADDLWWCTVDTGTKVQSSWNWLTGSTPSSPAIFVSGSTLYMAVRGSGNDLWWCTVDTGTKVQSSWNWLQGSTSASPSIYVSGSTLYLTVKGTGDDLWWCTVDTGTKVQSSWNWLTGSTPSSPATFVSGTTMYIGVRGGADDLWWCTVDTGTKVQSSWNWLTGSTPSSPAINVLDETMYIGVRGTDDSLWWCTVDTGTKAQSSWNWLTGSTPSAPSIYIH